MKADMEAMKEQTAPIMEAMMSMRKIMEANAVAVAATSAVAKVNSMPPSGLKQMNHPTSDMVGKDLGSTGSPHDVGIEKHCTNAMCSRKPFFQSLTRYSTGIRVKLIPCPKDSG